MPRRVLEAATEYLQLESQIGGYEAAELSGGEIEHVLDSVGSLLGARSHEIAILENATRAWDEGIPHVGVHDLGRRKCGIVTSTINEKDPAKIRLMLRELNMNASVSTVGSTRLDMERRGLESVVRASVHYYNSQEEAEGFSEAVASIAPNNLTGFGTRHPCRAIG